MRGSIFLWVTLFPVTKGFLTRFACNLGTECTTDSELKHCKINQQHMLDDEESIWEWTNKLGPSEPTALRYSVNRNGDVTDFTLQWRGPDDSSVRDLLGFQIEFEDGDVFHNFVMDLRENNLIFNMGNATKITYQLTCHYNNPFSKAVHLRVYVTSLPKSINLDLTDKVIRDNISIFIPKYTFPNPSRKLPTIRVSQPAKVTEEGPGVIPFVIIAVVIVIILSVGIPVYLKLKAMDSCLRKRGVKAVRNNSLATKEQLQDPIVDEKYTEVKTYTHSRDDTQKKWCQEVCVPFIVECETMTSLPQCAPCFHHMDSYDSGFHSDYQVLYAEPQDYKEDIRSEKQPTEDGKMKEHDIECERLPWFHAPLSESPSLTSVQTEDLEEEILRINKIPTRHEDKG